MDDLITLRRAYLPDQSGTLGALYLPGGWGCRTLERPWQNNARNVSCIPEGVYRLQLRPSPVVQRSSGGEFAEGWEITGVPERSAIMVHVGNWTSDTEGCLLVGRDYWWSDKGPMVTHSRDTFRALMERLAKRDTWLIDIRSVRT